VQSLAYIRSMFLVALATCAVAADGEPQRSATSLTEDEATEAVAYLFNAPMDFLRIDQCIEQTSVAGKGFDMQMTVLRSCRLSLLAVDFQRLITESFPPLHRVSLPPDHVPSCPRSRAFSAVSAYFSASSLDARDYNDIVIYVSADHASLLACQKVLIVR